MEYVSARQGNWAMAGLDLGIALLLYRVHRILEPHPAGGGSSRSKAIGRQRMSITGSGAE
jgi:hypothetical protein